VTEDRVGFIGLRSYPPSPALLLLQLRLTGGEGKMMNDTLISTYKTTYQITHLPASSKTGSLELEISKAVPREESLQTFLLPRR